MSQFVSKYVYASLRGVAELPEIDQNLTVVGGGVSYTSEKSGVGYCNERGFHCG